MTSEKFLLPTFYKGIGVTLFILSLLIIIVSKLFPGWFSSIWPGPRLILYALICLGLLIIILTKEKIEDEFIRQIRLESFCFATIIAVFFGIVGIIVEQFFPKYIQTSVDIILIQLFSYIFWFRIKIVRAK